MQVSTVVFPPVVPLRVTTTGQCCYQSQPVWRWRIPRFTSDLWWSFSHLWSPKHLRNWYVNSSKLFSPPEFKLAYVVLFCFDRFISIVTSTSAKDQIAPSLAEVICADLSVTLIGIFHLCHRLNTVTCLSGMQKLRGTAGELILDTVHSAPLLLWLTKRDFSSQGKYLSQSINESHYGWL